jgi:exodeoxyribonuclease X
MQPAIFITDTETTGATLADKIVDIAFIEVDDELNVLREVQSLVDPQRPISFSAQAIHGITPEMVADKPTIEELFSVVLPEQGFTLPEDVQIIAHNSMFDRRYVEVLPFPKISGFTCTLRLARRYLPKAENHKLTTLVYQYGLYKGEAHGALEDARMALSLLKFIVELSEKGIRDLIEEQRVPQWVAVCPFAKYKDQPMTAVDRGYAQWALGKMENLDPDMRYTLTCIASGKIPANV